MALKNMNELLEKKGKLIILEPALPGIYGALEKTENCFRRYTKKSINNVLTKNGFTVKSCRYTNIIGAVGWFVNSKILKRNVLDAKQMKVYDKIIPFISFIENIINPPIGLSLICVCERG